MLWLPVIAVTALTVAACGVGMPDAIIYNYWIPPLVWLTGVTLLAARRRWSWPAVIVLAYAIALGIFDPMLLLQRGPWSGAWYALLVAPFAWAGVTDWGRDCLATALGAWLLLFGQLFILVFNTSHGWVGLGWWYAWIS